MLKKVAPDAVFDVTVPEAHVDMTLTALKHGCHVLGEKPLADSMKNARKMVVAAPETGKIYAVIQNRRYAPRIRRLRSFVESGEIGNVATVNSDFYIGARFGGFRDRMRRVLLLDMAIHTFDAARFVAGAAPVSVYCKEWNPSDSCHDHDASAVAFFEMTNGVVYVYRGRWCSEGLNTTCRDDEIPPGDVPGKVGGHAGLIAEFVRCLQTGETPETVCTDNIKSLARVFGAMESAEKGKCVEVQV